MVETDILIVGCGLSGLIAAQTLQEAGYKVLVLDKGRGVGGRLATRRIGPGRLDHGAQFFTTREPAFEAMVADWRTAGLVFEWSRGWDNEAGHPRYAIQGGVNALAKHLAQNLDIRRQTTVTRAWTEADDWFVETHSGNTFKTGTLLLTAPVPQSLAILAAGNTFLRPVDQSALERIRYTRCICGLFWLDGDINVPDHGVLQLEGEPITWLADNQRKSISPEARLITVHTAPDYSEKHWDSDREMVLDEIQAVLQRHLQPGCAVKDRQYHRWGFAMATVCHPEPYLRAAELPRLVFAGDAFGDRPRIEGAALSGLAAANHLLHSPE